MEKVRPADPGGGELGGAACGAELYWQPDPTVIDWAIALCPDEPRSDDRNRILVLSGLLL